MKTSLAHHATRLARHAGLFLLAATLAACTTPVPLDEPAPVVTQDTTPAQPSQPPTTSTTPPPVVAAVPPTPVMDPFSPSSPLAQERSVYFEFDSFTVDEQYNRIVDMHANYLVNNPQQTIRLEGHADARGGSEYNLALGQRRSDAVARRLTLLGVRSSQIETISFGKERPKALGTTEADYAENRRADIVYQP